MPTVILIAYAAGAVMGLLATRIEGLARVWPAIVRAQVLAGAVALSVVAVWRIPGIDSLLWSAAIGLCCVAIFIVALALCKGEGRSARASLEAWAAAPNTTFWVIPVAAAVGGPAAATTAVIVDRVATPVYALWTSFMRRGAPIQQRRRSSLIDQAPTFALVVGVLLRVNGPAPDWTATVTLIATPLLAMSGAAVFVGSALHPTQRIDYRPGTVRWFVLAGTRIIYLIPVFLLAPEGSLKAVALLYALSIPSFIVSQLSTVYGYADPVVAAGRRWGWLVGAVGLLVLFAWQAL